MTFSHTSKLFFLLFFICTTFICLSSSTLTQYSVLGPNLDRLPSQDEAIQLFLQWKKEEGRAYSDLEEMANKFKTFLSNVKYITESNANRTSPSDHLLAPNKFADWSPEEFQDTYLHNLDLDLPTEHRAMDVGIVSDAPSSLDWRQRGAVTEVKDQRSCASSWAFSATGAIEGINQIAGVPLISLSEQELLDCAYNLGCEKGGSVTKAYEWVINNGGIASESEYPYTAVNGTCHASEVTKKVSINSYSSINRIESALFSATVNQPISVLVDATDFQFYRTGIFDGHNCEKDSTYQNHAVLIVGYDSLGTGQDYWIVKNSWGPNWGLNGYIWIKRNTGLPYGVCAINAWATYPIKTHIASS